MSAIERYATRAVVFLAGAMLMAIEVAAFRIIGKSFGSALRETTAVIAVFLAAMSVGYWAGGKAGDRWPRSATIAAALLCAAATLFVIPWLDPLIADPLAASTVPLALHAFIATGLLFALPSAFFASVSPVAVRLFVNDTTQSGSTAGSISAISTAGSIAGTIATAFFLLEWLESINRTVIAIATLSCVTAALLIAVSGVALRRSVYVVAAASALLLFSTAAFVRSTKIDASLLRDAPGWTTLFAGDSPYHHVTVREWHSRRRVLSFGLGEQSWMLVGDPYGAGATYTASLHLSRVIRPNTHRVLVIGLGGGTAAKQFTHDYEDVTCDAVEVDPLVISVAQRFFDVHPSDRLRLHNADGRAFLQQTRDRWDLIIVDAYTTNRYGATVPPHLVTAEFFREAASHLTPGGIVHFHCAFGGTKLLPALEKTMATVFLSTVVTGGEVLSSNEPIVLSKETLMRRMRQSPAARLPVFSDYVTGVRSAQTTVDAPLLTDDYAPIDALLRRRR